MGFSVILFFSQLLFFRPNSLLPIFRCGEFCGFVIKKYRPQIYVRLVFKDSQIPAAKISRIQAL